MSRLTLVSLRSYDRVRPCKLVELGYSPQLSRRGTVPKPPKPEDLQDLISPPTKNLFPADTVTPPMAAAAMMAAAAEAERAAQARAPGANANANGSRATTGSGADASAGAGGGEGESARHYPAASPSASPSGVQRNLFAAGSPPAVSGAGGTGV